MHSTHWMVNETSPFCDHLITRLCCRYTEAKKYSFFHYETIWKALNTQLKFNELLVYFYYWYENDFDVKLLNIKSAYSKLLSLL